jgi:hypothetical protein
LSDPRWNLHMARELPTKKSLLSELDELESRLIFSPISPRGDGISSSKFRLRFDGHIWKLIYKKTCCLHLYNYSGWYTEAQNLFSPRVWVPILTKFETEESHLIFDFMPFCCGYNWINIEGIKYYYKPPNLSFLCALMVLILQKTRKGKIIWALIISLCCNLKPQFEI